MVHHFCTALTSGRYSHWLHHDFPPHRCPCPRPGWQHSHISITLIHTGWEAQHYWMCFPKTTARGTRRRWWLSVAAALLTAIIGFPRGLTREGASPNLKWVEMWVCWVPADKINTPLGWGRQVSLICTVHQRRSRYPDNEAKMLQKFHEKLWEAGQCSFNQI